VSENSPKLRKYLPDILIPEQFPQHTHIYRTFYTKNPSNFFSDKYTLIERCLADEVYVKFFYLIIRNKKLSTN